MSSDASAPAKRVYLDVCALCRPFDDQQQVRIRLETSAVELILAHVRQKSLELIVSAVHQVEIGAIAEAEERQHLHLLLNQFGSSIPLDLTASRKRAEHLVAQGMGIADAAHVALAEAGKADFVSVDDRLLKQCRRVRVAVWCGTPPAFCEKEDLR
jgi:predicted nucleic acid-binding protein